MIFRRLQTILAHYANKPVQFHPRYHKSGKVYEVVIPDFYNIRILQEQEYEPSYEFRGMQYTRFTLGDWHGGTLYLYVVGKRGYVPNEDKPNG